MRVADGHFMPVIEPRSGILPEDRYRFAAPGKGELGQGAIGQVHLVFDAVLGREVAMKVLRDEYRVPEDSSDARQNEATWRFLREARVTGQLEHPNIVPVHELGCHGDGSVYYTMRVVRGRTLGEALSKATSLKARLALLHHFTDLCQAIAYAHSRGVLHRDIKPSNVMIGEFGETFVLDWGLARVAKPTDTLNVGTALSFPPAPIAAHHKSIEYDDHEHTALGGIVGTPQYMSPEQILGNHETLDARSDVWSLGVVLYILLTGRSPFAASTMQDVLSRVLTKDIPLPITLEPRVPVELQAIAMRALMRNKTTRYGNASEMANDVTAYQSGARVEAYDYGSMELIRRFLARHRAAALVTGIACCALVFLATLSYLRIRHARDDALFAERRATAGQELANSRYADALVEKSRTAAGLDDVIEAEILAGEAVTTGRCPDARGILMSLSSTTRLVPSSRPSILESCTQVIATPKSDHFLCLSSDGLSAYRGVSARWSVKVSGVLSAAPVGANEWAVLVEGGRWILYSEVDGHVLAAGNSPLIRAIALAGAEHQGLLAAVDATGNVAVWSAHEVHVAPTLLHLNQAVTAFSFAHGHPWLIMGGKLGRLSVWDFAGQVRKETLIGDSHATIESMAVGTSDGLVITGGSDGAVSVWDLPKARFLGNALQRPNGISSLSLSEQGRWLIAGTRSAEADLIDMQQRTRVFSTPRGAGPFRPLGFDQNGQAWLLRSSTELMRYEIVEPSPRPTLLDRGNVLALSWLPGSEYLFTGGLRDSGVCLFRLSDGACMDRIPVRLSQVRVVAVSPNGHYLVLAGVGNVVQVWDAQSRLPITIGEVPIQEVRSVAFDGPQTHVYLGGVAAQLLKLHLASGKVIEQWDVDGQVQTMALTRDAQSLVLGLRDGRIQLRDTQGRLRKQAPVHQGWVTGLALSSSHDLAVSVGADGKTQFWRPSNLEVLDSQQDHTGRVTALALSADGKYIATGGEDQTLVVSEAHKPWRRIARLQGQRGTVRCLAFDPSSKWLAAGGDDASVKLWNVQLLDADPRSIQAKSSATWGLRLDGARLLREK